MEFYGELLAGILAKGEIRFPNLECDVSKIIEQTSYQALQKIKTIVENDSLSDFECVEEIVCVLEGLGSDGGGRHDFG